LINFAIFIFTGKFISYNFFFVNNYIKVFFVF
jgi:hypothetical protein